MKKLIIRILVLITALLMVGMAQAGLILSESFDYNTTYKLMNIGSGTGWGTNLWISADGCRIATNPPASLVYPSGTSLVAFGTRLSGIVGGVTSTRVMENSISTTNTYYMSFLAQKNAAGSFYIQTMNATQARFGVQVATNGAVNMLNASGQWINILAAGTFPNDTTYMVLARTSATNTSVAFCSAGVPVDESSVTWNTLTRNITGVVQDRVKIHNSTAVAQLDEFRFGDTFESVTSNLELSLPLDNAVLNEYNPELSWMMNSPSNRVRVQIATDSSFTNIIVDEEVHSFVHRFVPSDDLDPDDYWWRVASEDQNTQTWGSWSGSRKFTVQHNATTINIDLSDSLATIRWLVMNAPNNSRIVFEQGVYTFSASQIGSADFIIKLFSKTNIVVDGNGSTIVFDGKITSCAFGTVSRCTDVTLKNFTIERPYKMHLALEITNVDTTNGYFICERVDTNFPLPAVDSAQYEASMGWIVDKDSKKIKFGTPLTLDIDTETSGVYETTRWKYYLADTNMDNTNMIHNLRVGDIFIKRDEVYSASSEMYFAWVRNLTLYNLKADGSNLGFNVRGIKNDSIKVLNCSWEKDYFCGSDGLFLEDQRGGAWIEDNIFSGSSDDLLVIRATKYANTVVDDHTIRLADYEDVRVGDVLHFYEDNNAWKYVTEMTVTNVQDVGSEYEVSLSGGTVTSNLTSHCNYALAGPGTVIKGNLFDGHRGDVFNMHLDGAIIEDNVFSDIGERAICLSQASGGGSYSRNVYINNNIFNNICRINTEGMQGAFLTLKYGSLTNCLNNNIYFVNNFCLGYPSTALQIYQAQNVYITNNWISSGEYNDASDWYDENIVLVSETDNIFVHDNVFVGHRYRTSGDYSTVSNADGWAADNPDFDNQFYLNLWTLSKINHSEAGSEWVLGECNPARSLTRIKLTGSGSMDGSNTTDKCTFANVALMGDCDLSMKVYGLSVPVSTDFSKGGLMIRESTNSNSKMAMLAIQEYNGNYYIQHLSRTSTAGGLVADSTVSLSGFPVHLNLVRTGDLVISSYSYNELDWTILASNSISMSDVTVGGGAISSQATGELATLSGDELRINYE